MVKNSHKLHLYCTKLAHLAIRVNLQKPGETGEIHYLKRNKGL
jgi:hypothetical protein